MQLQDAITGFTLHCYARGLSEQTVAWYEAQLRVFSRYVEELQLTDAATIKREHLVNFMATQRAKNLSTHSLYNYATAVRQLFFYLASEGYIELNPAEKLPIPKKAKKVINTFSDQQLKSILSAPNRKTYTGLTHYTVMLTLLDTGLRVSELTSLEDGKVHIKEGFMVVHGKGDKERAVPLGKKVSAALFKYRSVRPEPIFGHFFVGGNGRPYSRDSVHGFIKHYGKQFNIKGVRVSPHTFRHTFAKRYLMNGGDVFSLQKILGHSSLAVVQNYVHMASDDVLVQHKRFSPVDRL